MRKESPKSTRRWRLDPNSYVAHYNLGWLLEASEDLPGAIVEYKKGATLDSDPFALALLGHTEALAGDRARRALVVVAILAAGAVP